MTIVGIDPGTGRLGYSAVTFGGAKPLILTYGCFEYSSKLDIPARLVLIEKDISELLETYKPHALAIETLLFNKNVTTAMQVSEARGVIALCAAKRGIAIQNCSPLQVKMSVTGYGKADKNQVKQMVQLQFNLKTAHKIDDAIDALAIALTGYTMLQSNRLTNTLRA